MNIKELLAWHIYQRNDLIKCASNVLRASEDKRGSRHTREQKIKDSQSMMNQADVHDKAAKALEAALEPPGPLTSDQAAEFLRKNRLAGTEHMARLINGDFVEVNLDMLRLIINRAKEPNETD